MSKHRRFKRSKKTTKLNEKHNKFKTKTKLHKTEKLVEEAKNFVLNLSNRKLSDTEYILLSKGLKFVPTTKFSTKQLLRDFKKFERSMRLKYYFSENPQIETKIHPFKPTSKLSAPIIGDNAVEKYLFYTKLELSEYRPEISNNLTKMERRCLKNLKRDKSICIHKADKNNVTVIQNTCDYIAEAECQLNDGIHYEKIEKININETETKVQQLVISMKNNNEIDETTFKFLNIDNKKHKIPKAYFLPKIHKLDKDILDAINIKGTNNTSIHVPTRPIISQCESALENMGRFLDFILLPFVKRQETYLSDTSDFIRHIELTKVREQDILVTYDITSLYTNLSFSEIENSIRKVLTENAENEAIQYEIKVPQTEWVLKMIHLILSLNEFTFNRNSYRQIIGASMGAVASPEICDITINNHIETILKSFEFTNKIVFHKRMRDDGIIIYRGNPAEIKQLFHMANTHHELIKFTFEINKESIVFLDTVIYKGERYKRENILDIKCHTKNTEKFQYLHRNSNHPNACFKSFIKAEGIRILRNTSSDIEYSKRINLFTEKLVKRGYNKIQIQSILSKIKHINRQEKLKRKQKETNQSNKNTFVTTFHPNAERLQTILKKFWDILQRDPRTKQLFNVFPITAFKRDKNIGEILKQQ